MPDTTDQTMPETNAANPDNNPDSSDKKFPSSINNPLEPSSKNIIRQPKGN